MSYTVPDKVKEAVEDAKKAVDRREDQIEQTRRPEGRTPYPRGAGAAGRGVARE
jgi:hypothetical protein